MHGGQVARMPLHQRSRQLTAGHQGLRAVSVGHDVLKQAHALEHAALDLLPVCGRNDEWKQIQRPRPLRLFAVCIHVVGDAVVAHLAL